MLAIIKTAAPEQLAALSALLTRNHLAADDLPDSLPNFWVAIENDQIIGSIGIETYGDVGLLRSLCVDSDYRNQGLAQKLFRVAQQESKRLSIRNLYLLTTTAEHYFARFGFIGIDRTEAPEAIRQTTQFSSLCPSSAILMQQTH